MKPRTLCLCFLTLSLLPALADWPQWRGPNRDGVSTDTTPIAETFPEEGLKVVWESDFIPSDHYGGHGSPVIAGERAYMAVVWHDREPSETREIDSEVMQQMSYRGVSPELAKEMEEARLGLSGRVRGEALETFVDEWVEANLTEKEKLSVASWIRSRFRQGRAALPLEDLAKVSKRQGKPFANADEFRAWMDEAELSEPTKEKLIQAVPNTIKVAKDVLVCLDMTTGKEVWKFEAEGKPTGRKSSSTAAIVDDHAYFVGSTHVYCVNLANGTLTWKAETPAKGPAASPLVVDGKVFVSAGSAVALSAKDGSMLWEQKGAKGDTGSPAWWTPSGSDPVLVVTGSKAQFGLNPATGELVWEIAGGGQSTPVTSGDWMVIYSGAKDVGLRAYKFQPEGAPEAQWSHFWVTRRYNGSPIIHDGNVYLTCGEKHQCVDLESGEVRWAESYKSTITSPILVDGKILVFENNGSHLKLFGADPEGYEIMARPKVGAMGCTSPALSNGRMVVRQKEKLVCYDLRPTE
jgi:outer membrane protein assembly factor BamB